MAAEIKYSPELGQEIADLIAENYTLRDIAAMEGMPPRSTITSWAIKHVEFSAKCARAREMQADVIVDEMNETLESVKKGKLSPEQGRVILSGNQWIAAKKRPKVYGDKMTLAGDADNPLFALGKRLDAIQQQEKGLIDVTPAKDSLPPPGEELC